MLGHWNPVDPIYKSFARKHRLSHGTFSLPLAAVRPGCVFARAIVARFFSLGNWYVIERTPRKKTKHSGAGIDQGFCYMSFFGGILDITFTYVYGLKMMAFLLPGLRRTCVMTHLRRKSVAT